MSLLDPIFDLFRSRKDSEVVYAIVTYENGDTEKIPIGRTNMSMGEMHREFNRMYVEDLDRRLLEMVNRKNEEIV